ncbi:MAG: hypothetical protein ACYCYI_08600 [Saccharofermentanales bacterium]
MNGQDKILLYAKDFGAIPDGSTNSAETLQKLISHAVALSSDKAVEILLDEGEYRLKTEKPNQAVLSLMNAKNITISGIKDKTFFVIENPNAGSFNIDGCENILIQNIVIDYDPLPYTQGTIVAIDKENCSLDLEIDENYSLPDAEFFANANLRLGTKIILAGDETQYGKLTLIASYASRLNGRIYRIHTSSTNQFNEDNSAYSRSVFENAGFTTGDRFYYSALMFTQAAICAWRTRNITLKDFMVYAGPSVITMWALCDTVHIDGLVTRIKPDTDRLLSANADGVHALGVRNGIMMENCYFAGNGDDGVNIHSRSGIIKKVISSTQILIDNGACSDYRIGDNLQIMSHRTIKATVDVVSVITDGNMQTVTFNPPVEDIRAGTKLADSDNVLNLSACCQGSVFRNNVFGISAGRSMLISSHDILVENNTFKNINGWAINLTYDANYGEGPIAYNIVIKDNVFTGVGSSRFPTLNMWSITPWSGSPVQGEHPIKNVLFENNTFMNPRNTVIYANGVDGLMIRNNEAITEGPSKIGVNPFIHFENSNGIIIEDFKIDDPNKNMNDTVKISENMDAGPAGIIIGNISSIHEEYSVKISDERK